MEGFCRGCLIKYDDPEDLLQYTEKNRRLYVYSTGLQVKRNDAFPFQLCKDCYVNMKLSCKFKKQCRTSDKRFRNYLGLKEAGEVNDFCTFLKNNDDSLMFRFPLRSGYSTPGYQKPRDDDDESTCTSIRNFMTDILQAEEIPDTEARIIREVIEEEADVLDDSLDSHWLQDDASIDTDFRLDFSFSPFTTPQSVNNDRCNTPQKLRELVQSIKIIGKKENTGTDQPKSTKQNVDTVEPEIKTIVATDPIVNAKKIELKIDDIVNMSENETAVKSIIDENDVRQQNFYVEIEQFQEQDEPDNVIEIEGNKDFSIEKNLAAALNENDKEFLLEDILKSPSNKEYVLENVMKTPSICPIASGASTPTINNILFGEKIEENPISRASTPNINKILFGDKFDENEVPVDGVFTEKYEPINVDIDLLDEFFQDHNQSFKVDENNQCEKNFENIKLRNDSINDDPRFDLINAICKICDRKSKNLGCLKMHLMKKHKIKLLLKKKRSEKRKYKICDTCGKQFRDIRNLIKHIKNHENSKSKHSCKKCFMKFTSLANLNAHKITHRDMEERQKVAASIKHRYICTICGVGVANSTVMKTHLQRHQKNYVCFCDDCGRGFYRKHDLTVHVRTHFGDRPFECEVCGKKFARSDTLNRHMKIHMNEKPHMCKYCKVRFTRLATLKVHLRRSLNCRQSRILEEIMKRESQAGSAPSTRCERQFECEVCGKKFARLYTLNRHMKNHTSEKPYVCKVCKEGFSRRTALEVHRKRSLNCRNSRRKHKTGQEGETTQTSPAYFKIVDDDGSKLILDEGTNDNNENGSVLPEFEEINIEDILGYLP